MNQTLNSMLAAYELQTDSDKKNAMKEIIQELILCALSRTDFFEKAAFYGGTALRIFYGLDRFSEDLDFSLLAQDHQFDFNKYLPIIENEVRAYGLNVHAQIKEKSVESDIQSAFLKANTREQILIFYADDNLANTFPKSELIKVKFEIDTNPPPFASFEYKYRLLPIPYQIRLYDVQSLFAGKLHAVLCRGWKDRVKGRDLYDFVFYLSNKFPVNLKHLNARLIDSGFIEKHQALDESGVVAALNKRFQTIDFEAAKEDVLPFIKNPAKLDLWNYDFFTTISTGIQFV